MKKFGKLKLHDTVVMSDSELKNIVGGTSDPSSTEAGGTGTPCFVSATCPGANSIECSGNRCESKDGDVECWIDGESDSIHKKCPIPPALPLPGTI